MPTNSTEYVLCNREKIRAEHKEWVSTHRDRDHATSKRWRDDHKGQRLAYHAVWLEKHPEYQRTRNFELRHRFKLIMLLGGECELCGFNDTFVALQFHHTNPKDKENDRWIKEEDLTKVMLVCANCHKEIHALKAEEFYKELRKGSLSAS